MLLIATLCCVSFMSIDNWDGFCGEYIGFELVTVFVLRMIIILISTYVCSFVNSLFNESSIARVAIKALHDCAAHKSGVMINGIDEAAGFYMLLFLPKRKVRSNIRIRVY